MKTRIFPHLILLIALALSLVGSALTVTPARAAGIVVNSAGDVIWFDGVCTLREAIINANDDAATNADCAAGSGADIITFAGNYVITVSSELPVITTEMEIWGNGAANTIIQASTCNPINLPGGCTPANHRVFRSSALLILHSLTVRHGRCDGSCAYSSNHGGGILVTLGGVAIKYSIISDNYAQNSGGGLANVGTGNLVTEHSTFTNNYASSGSGGGIYNGSGWLIVTGSTFSFNHASWGGGIYNYGGSLHVSNSTFANNEAISSGGGIEQAVQGSSVTLTHVTLSGNAAPFGGGINADYITTTLRNSIIANSIGDDCSIIGGTMAAINSFDTDGSCGDATQKTSAQVNLGPLQENGGNTQTMALGAGSHAIDAAYDLHCANPPISYFDQRGVARPAGACDIGAYEVEKYTKMFRSTGAQDGWVLESNENGNIGESRNNTATTFRLGDDAANRQYRAILSFNTASLPDNAIIIKVTLKIKKYGAPVGTDPFTILGGLRVDIGTPFFGSTAGLASHDFQSVASKSNIGTIPNTPVSNWYTKIWSTDTFFSFINLTGTTQFRLRFLTDDNNDNGADYMRFYSGEAATSYRPQLIIEYYVP